MKDTKLRDIEQIKKKHTVLLCIIITECRMEFLRKEFGIDRHSVEVREREIRSGHETRAILK